MDGVSPRRLVERRLGLDAFERVATVAQPVRPRCEHLTAPPGAPLLGPEAGHDLTVAHREGAEGGPDLGHHGPLVAVADDPLVTRGGGGLRRSLVIGRVWQESWCGRPGQDRRSASMPTGMVGDGRTGPAGRRFVRT